MDDVEYQFRRVLRKLERFGVPAIMKCDSPWCVRLLSICVVHHVKNPAVNEAAKRFRDGRPERLQTNHQIGFSREFVSLDESPHDGFRYFAFRVGEWMFRF